MAKSLKNNVVIITGGSIGIGAKVIEFLLKENVKHVANLDIAEGPGVALQNKLNKTYSGNRVKFIKCDVANETQLLSAYEAVIKDQGYVDIVINNAGIMNDTKDKYKKEIEINVTALTTSTLKALEVMRKDEGGRGGIVMNISSIASLTTDFLLPIYCGTKTFVLRFSNCLGLPHYFNRTGVKVMVMCFGATDTTLVAREKVGNFDKVVDTILVDEIKNRYRFQKVESAAQGLIDALKKGDSGSTWLAIADKPAQDVSNLVTEAYDILSKPVFENL